LGFETQPEKDKIHGESLRQSTGFGAVDVFIVDNASRRFILVEAKNVADEGFVPKTMMNEYRKFIGYIKKLQSQTEWFKSHISDLKREHGIPIEESYTVEGVIVANRPRPWMFTQDEPIPVVDYHKFFEILEDGGEFVTFPTIA